MNQDHFNDIKHQALLWQNGKVTGSMDDEELIFVHNQIINPTPSGQINDAWVEHFDELGIPAGSFNDRAENFIRVILPLSEAETLTELWYDYWTSLLP